MTKFLRRCLPMPVRLWIWHRGHHGYRGECYWAETYETSLDSDWGDPVDVMPVPASANRTVNSWYENGGRVVLTSITGPVILGGT